ncbi:hypothetical protein PLESTB_000345000 [Pleodorina starrii]|uniref:Uncharacterized protein n=1 Tax=Pleodorina starrii TaxID=330485 RepID=A0A9W6EYU7_9CHLO|nr:hypothetical protein PLESTM_000049900 [Pleodorina starrii]GLC50127.1 hypothetical protein PLESTB_000345000 [Pleodorina starrii]GLC73093.1 hypothetical protein PLESTF_001331400 [Pleodorina starrii]
MTATMGINMSGRPTKPLDGIIYTVHIRRGVSSNRTFLSCTSDGTKVDLCYYHIEVLGGVGCGRRLVSCSPDGERTELVDADDGSGRQRWILEPTTNGYFLIRVQAGISAAASGRRYLSCTSCGQVVDLWTHDDGSGRQQWLLRPETVRLTRLDFQLEAARVTALPDHTSSVTISNASCTPQNATFNFSRKAPQTSWFDADDDAVEMVAAAAAGGSGSVAVPCCLASGRVALSPAAVWKYGTDKQRQADPRDYALPLLVPPRSRVSATVGVPVAELEVPYIARGRSAMTGKEMVCRGVWRGTSLGEMGYLIEQQPL